MRNAGPQVQLERLMPGSEGLQWGRDPLEESEIWTEFHQVSLFWWTVSQVRHNASHLNEHQKRCLAA